MKTNDTITLHAVWIPWMKVYGCTIEALLENDRRPNECPNSL